MRATLKLKHGGFATIDTTKIVTYLSGSMEMAPDHGVPWRQSLSKKLQSLGIKAVNILDPCNKKVPKDHQFSKVEDRKYISELREDLAWKELEDYMDFVAHYDLRMVDHSDFVVCKMSRMGRGFTDRYMPDITNAINTIDQRCADKSRIIKAVNQLAAASQDILVPTFGTTHEVVEARRQKKPVFLICEKWRESLPAWMIWLVGSDNVFDSEGELVTRLGDILGGDYAVSDREWSMCIIKQTEGDDQVWTG